MFGSSSYDLECKAMAAPNRGKAPEWAARLVAEHAPAGTSVRWILQPKGQGAYGCCNVYAANKRITVFANTMEPTNEARLVVLHEIGHALDPVAEHVPGRKKATFHGPRFWGKVMALYQLHGLLAYAAKREGYATGRKLASKLAAAGAEATLTWAAA